MHNNKKYTLQEVKEYIEQDPEYKLLSTEYKDCDTPLDVLHTSCNTIFHPTFSNFRKYGTRCPKCFGVHKIDYDYVKKYIESSGDYVLISKEYTGAFGDLEILCKKCNNIFKTTWARYKQGSRCKYCKNNKRRNNFEYIKDSIEKDGNYLLLSDKYVNARQKLLLKCKKCGRIFSISWNKFSQGRRCPCNSPGGNKFIYDYLISHNYKENIDFVREYKDKNCKDILPLTFDFRINTKSGYFLLEIQGKQHYSDRYSKFYSDKLILHDNIKKKYCAENFIKLLEIMYDGNTKKLLSNFEKILNEEALL